MSSPRVVAALTLLLFFPGIRAEPITQVPDSPITKSLRLFVFDCGTLDVADTGRFRLKREEVTTDKLSVACYLVVHPRGTLVWDTGAVADAAVKAGNTPTRTHIALPNNQERWVTIARPLGAQMTEAGYAPANITYLALSHYHYDHTANSNLFARATWLVRPVEHDAMFAAKLPDLVQPSSYDKLQGGKTVLIKGDEHDVFGDGSVVLKLAAGHTPGHQVMLVKLARTGPVLLSGDLYHYPEERTLKRLPTFEFDEKQTAAARAAIDAFLKKTGAQLWIQHDFAATAKLRKAPQYYD